MTVVRHPTLDAQYDVPERDVPRWVAAGWNTEGAPQSDHLKMVGDQGPVLTAVSTPDEKPRPVKRPRRKK